MTLQDQIAEAIADYVRGVGADYFRTPSGSIVRVLSVPDALGLVEVVRLDCEPTRRSVEAASGLIMLTDDEATDFENGEYDEPACEHDWTAHRDGEGDPREARLWRSFITYECRKCGAATECEPDEYRDAREYAECEAADAARDSAWDR
jgi:hypothetical protein